jgi:magnesium transporter
MIVDTAVYRDGHRVDVDGDSDIDGALDLVRGQPGSFLWIGLHEPTTAEFDLVKERLDLDPRVVDDAAQAHQRPKLERHGDTVFVVVKTLRYADPVVDVGEIMLFIGADFVVTVRHGEAAPLTAVRKRLESEPALLGCGPSAVLYAVCDEVVDGYNVIVHEMEADLVELERRVFESHERHMAAEIYALKREVLKFRGAEDPLIVVLQHITRGRTEAHPDMRQHFEHVMDDLLRVDGAIDAHNELLTGILNAHLAQVGVRQNDDMRKISAWAAIIATPTMIAGIYGMNFDHMPELRWVIGYPLALAVMAVACLVVYRRLRKSGWL